jgi:integrase
MGKVNRRQHGEGSVYQRKDGRWVAAEDLGVRGGKRDRRYFYGATADEAMKKRERFRDRRKDGFTLPKGRQPYVSEWLLHWFHTTCKREVEETTWQGYKSKVELWTAPFFERVLLAELTEEDIEDWHAWMEGQVSGKTGRPLSPSTIGQTHRILSECVRLAVARGRTPRNPVSNVTPPPAALPDLEPPTAAEVRRIMARCRTWPTGARWVLGITTGLRQGEILGLEWPQVKLDGDRPSVSVLRSAARVSGKGRVVKAPKSRSSRRSVPLSVEAVAALRAFRDGQKVRVIGGKGDVLFRGSRLGRPLHPRVDYADWHALLDDLGIPHYRPHDIRHGYATMLLEEGVDPRVVQALLGHSTGVLLTRYQHVRENMHDQAASAISRAVSGDA